MGKHLEEKSLIAVNENSLFYKIKSFFLKLFRGKKNALKWIFNNSSKKK